MVFLELNIKLDFHVVLAYALTFNSNAIVTLTLLCMQAKRRVLETDEWLRVKGCENVYAIGDCATIDQRKVMVSEAFNCLILLFRTAVVLLHYSCNVSFYSSLS